MDTKDLNEKRRDFLKGSLAIGATGMLMGLPASFSAFLSQDAEAASSGGATDTVGENDDLVGFVADYVYPSGPAYVISFTKDKCDFSSPWPGEKRKQPPPSKEPSKEPPKEGTVRPPSAGVDYRARKIKDGLYLVHWIVNWEIHVALLLDFEEKRTICAALMPGKSELWDVAYWKRWIVPPALKKYEMKG
jgi:hypothetical protein